MSLENKPVVHALNKNQHAILSPFENDKQIEDPGSREGSSEGMRSELEARFTDESRITKESFIKGKLTPIEIIPRYLMHSLNEQGQQMSQYQQQQQSISPSKEGTFYTLVKAKKSEIDEGLIKGARKNSQVILEAVYASNQAENKHIQIKRNNANTGDNYRNRNQSLPEISAPNRNLNAKSKPLNLFQNQLIQQKVAPLALESKFSEYKTNNTKMFPTDPLNSRDKDEDDDEYEYPKEKNITQSQSISAQIYDTSNNPKLVSQLQSESPQQINSSNGGAVPLNKPEGYGIHLTHKRKVLGQRHPFQLKKVSVQTSSTCNLLETVVQQQMTLNYLQKQSKTSNILRIFDESSMLEDTSASTNYSGGVNDKKCSPLTKLLSPVSKLNSPIGYYLSQSSKKIDTDACKNSGILNCKSFSSTRNFDFKPLQEDLAKRRVKNYFLGDTNATKEAVQMHCNGTSYNANNSRVQGKLRTLKDIFCTRSLKALEITKESIMGNDSKRASVNARGLAALPQEIFNNTNLGRFDGYSIGKVEQRDGLESMNALTKEQQQQQRNCFKCSKYGEDFFK